MSSTNEARILVVDDNRVNRMVLEGRLAQEKYEVVSASDGQEALEILGLEPAGNAQEPKPFDALVLDIMMPGIDGLEVLRRIRKVKSASELPVIMATTKDQTADIVQALEEGSNDYVTKPIDMLVLLARLRTQVSLKRTHSALKKAQASLIEAAKMESVGFLAAGVAHEVRNPLAQIQMGVEAIEHNAAVQADGSLKPVIEIVKEAVLKAEAIIQDLMTVSTTGAFELKPGSVNELLQDLTASLEKEGKLKGIKTTLDLDKKLPMARLAASEIRQVFFNLMANAIEAMPEGGALSIRTGSTQLKNLDVDEGSRSGRGIRSGSRAVMVEMTDTGEGIPEDKLQMVWDPFFTTKPTGNATGMGLSLAQKVVQLHDGLITLENRKEGKGTRVAVYLCPAH